MRHLVRVSAVWRFHGAFVLSFLPGKDRSRFGWARDQSQRAMGTLRMCLLSRVNGISIPSEVLFNHVLLLPSDGDSNPKFGGMAIKEVGFGH